jgi:uncharacterized MAPEG superfamily protein
MSVLTWVSIILASMIRTKSWSFSGLIYAMGNREDKPDTSALANRADRAASNTKENFILFVALALVAHAAGAQSPLVIQGAELFLWARIVYIPVYYLGIAYVRTLAWTAGIVGLAMMIAGMFA